MAPRRLVPVLSEKEMAGAHTHTLLATAPHLTYHGGALLTSVEVFTVFWGTAWQQPAQAAVAAHLNQFFDYILTSPLIDALAEYSVPGKPIGHGMRIGTTTILDASPGGTRKSLTDAQIQQHLQQWIAAGTVPHATGNTLYFVYTPPGVGVVMADRSRSCKVFCGYHGNVGHSIFYAVEPYLACKGCTYGSGVADSLTKVSSHELCEAITDPMGDGWFDDTPPGNEIGDICNSSVGQLGGYTVQLEWSNALKRCVL